MFTPKFNVHVESSDLLSYAKFFRLHGLSFNIVMHEPDKWVASTSCDDFSATTSFQDGPVSALRELHVMIRPMLNKLPNG